MKIKFLKGNDGRPISRHNDGKFILPKFSPLIGEEWEVTLLDKGRFYFAFPVHRIYWYRFDIQNFTFQIYCGDIEVTTVPSKKNKVNNTIVFTGEYDSIIFEEKINIFSVEDMILHRKNNKNFTPLKEGECSCTFYKNIEKNLEGIMCPRCEDIILFGNNVTRINEILAKEQLEEENKKKRQEEYYLAWLKEVTKNKKENLEGFCKEALQEGYNVLIYNENLPLSDPHLWVWITPNYFFKFNDEKKLKISQLCEVLNLNFCVLKNLNNIINENWISEEYTYPVEQKRLAYTKYESININPKTIESEDDIIKIILNFEYDKKIYEDEKIIDTPTSIFPLDIRKYYIINIKTKIKAKINYKIKLAKIWKDEIKNKLEKLGIIIEE